MVRAATNAKRGMRRALLLAAAAAVLLVGSGGLWVARCERHVLREIARLQAERRAWIDRNAVRPPARGTGAPGNAWDGYFAACAPFELRPLSTPDPNHAAPPPPAVVVAAADAIRAGAERLVARVDAAHRRAVAHSIFTPIAAEAVTAWQSALPDGRRPIWLVDAPGGLRHFERLRAAAGASWPAVIAALDAGATRARLGSWLGVPDPWDGSYWSRADWNLGHARRTVAMLRLLRAGAGEPLADLPDPFGDGTAPLRGRRAADRAVLWSVNPDGADDGGETARAVAGFEIGWKPAGTDLVLVSGPTAP